MYLIRPLNTSLLALATSEPRENETDDTVSHLASDAGKALASPFRLPIYMVPIVAQNPSPKELGEGAKVGVR